MSSSSSSSSSAGGEDYPAHNVFTFDNESIIFSSKFDNGNLARVERSGKYEFRIWTAADNFGTPHQSKHNAWFHFVVSGLPAGVTLRIQIVNASPHSGLYKHDMRPVYRCNATNQKWCRLRSCVRVTKLDDGSSPQLSFDHVVDAQTQSTSTQADPGAGDKIFFAFTYPYTYTMVQQDLNSMDGHINDFSDADSLFWQRELVSLTRDGRRVELLTITTCGGADLSTREPLLSGLFADSEGKASVPSSSSASASASARPPLFPSKDVIFVSARVHPGEVPAQWTLKGMLNMLLDRSDLIARQLLRRYVIKIIPMLNPDGVYRGHFRMDQLGQNLNRYYVDPDPFLQGPIYGAKKLLDYYAGIGKLSLYIDLHAHASKRGCFIYGNVMDRLEDQVQNMLFCRLIAMNTPHFDYEGCLFSREHMTRIDPGDQAKGLTAEGSSRVSTYLAHGIIHSYTLECNYNTAKIGNEVAATEGDPGGQHISQATPYVAYPEKFTPFSYAGVGRACLIALLDLRGQNPFSRVFRSKHKTLERVRQAVVAEVKQRREYKNQNPPGLRRSFLQPRGPSPVEEVEWRRVVSGSSVASSESVGSNADGAAGAASAPPVPPPPVPVSFAMDYRLSSDREKGQASEPTLSSSRKIMISRDTDFTVTGRSSPLNSPSPKSGNSPTVSAASAALLAASLVDGADAIAAAAASSSSSSSSALLIGCPPDSNSSPTGASRSPRPINVVVPTTDAFSQSQLSMQDGFGVRIKQPTSASQGPGNGGARSAGSGMHHSGLLPQRPDPLRSTHSQAHGKSSYGGRHNNILSKIARPGVAQFLLDPTSFGSSHGSSGSDRTAYEDGGSSGSTALDSARSASARRVGSSSGSSHGGDAPEADMIVPMSLSARSKLGGRFRHISERAGAGAGDGDGPTSSGGPLGVRKPLSLVAGSQAMSAANTAIGNGDSNGISSGNGNNGGMARKKSNVSAVDIKLSLGVGSGSAMPRTGPSHHYPSRIVGAPGAGGALALSKERLSNAGGALPQPVMLTHSRVVAASGAANLSPIRMGSGK